MTRRFGGPFAAGGAPGSLARSVAIAAIATLFLTFSGAFGTMDEPLPMRLGYWGLLIGGGYVWGSFVAGWFFRAPARRTGHLWGDAALATLIMSIPYTFVVWAVTRAMLATALPIHGLPYLFGPVVLISAAITALNVMVEAPRVTEAGPEPPKFLERLPLKLRGAEVWAVEAEDHYLRLHTSKGQDLILMRLADAVSELEGIEGAQVHRSWWVARDAIAGARRGDGRATLTLKDGSEAPVSRTYAGLLRERGWI